MEKMPALSIRQPYAELILRGLKRVEYRTRATKRRSRIYIYASSKQGDSGAFDEIGLRAGELPTGVLIGTVEIVACIGAPGDYEWHLSAPRRLKRMLKPKNHPQPSWFYPF